MLLRAEDRTVVDLEPGVRRSVLQSGEALMLVRIELAAGRGVAAHRHPHEQITHLVAGRVSFDLDGQELVLEPGDSVLLRPDVAHGARALEDSVLVDAFAPPREDFLSG